MPNGYRETKKFPNSFQKALDKYPVSLILQIPLNRVKLVI